MLRPSHLSRRAFLRTTLFSGLTLGAGLGAFEGARQGLQLLDLHETWEAAAAPNDVFLTRHASLLNGLELGGSFAPEQWSMDNAPSPEALRALDTAIAGLDLRRLRLGVRWNRAVNASGRVDLGVYAPYIDRCLTQGAEVCLNVGPIRTFRWPEEHVPIEVLSALDRRPAVESAINRDEPLAQAALSYLDELLAVLRREYGRSFATIQAENEPFYPLGGHLWTMSRDYMRGVVERIDEAFPEPSVLITSAGRLNLHSVRDVFLDLLSRRDGRFAGRLISGFDYHYKTPTRDAVPVVRYFDQIAYARPFAPTLEGHRRDARALGFALEVTEGQMEPYAQFTEPGNSVKHLRFLLLRTTDRVFEHKAPAKLLRLWGVEELTKKMVAGELTDEHRQMIALIQTINGAAHTGPAVLAS